MQLWCFCMFITAWLVRMCSHPVPMFSCASPPLTLSYPFTTTHAAYAIPTIFSPPLLSHTLDISGAAACFSGMLLQKQHVYLALYCLFSRFSQPACVICQPACVICCHQVVMLSLNCCCEQHQGGATAALAFWLVDVFVCL